MQLPLALPGIMAAEERLPVDHSYVRLVLIDCMRTQQSKTHTIPTRTHAHARMASFASMTSPVGKRSVLSCCQLIREKMSQSGHCMKPGVIASLPRHRLSSCQKRFHLGVQTSVLINSMLPPLSHTHPTTCMLSTYLAWPTSDRS
jgi:hypothetical protein